MKRHQLPVATLLLQSLASPAPTILAAPSISTTTVATSTSPVHLLHVNAIVPTPQNTSVLECWSLSNPFTSLGVPQDPSPVNSIMTLSNLTSSGSLIYIPGDSPSITEIDPSARWVFVLSGAFTITFPTSNEKVVIRPDAGKPFGNLLFVADLSGSGHTLTPSRDGVVNFGLPVSGNVWPEHEVVNQGRCRGQVFVEEG